MKMTALQGVIFATLILAVIGGALQVVANQLQTVNLSWMGSYQAPFVAFFANSWIIILVTFIYNVFMYLRQTQMATMQQTVELYDWRKLVSTLTWFIGVLGPMAALVTDPQSKGIISLLVVIATAVVQEISNVFGENAVTSNTITTATQAPALVTSATTQEVGTYQGWTVKLVNGWMQIYPPASLASQVGMSGYNVIGYPLSSILGMAKPYIDQAIAWLNTPKQKSTIVPPAQITS